MNGLCILYRILHLLATNFSNDAISAFFLSEVSRGDAVTQAIIGGL